MNELFKRISFQNGKPKTNLVELKQYCDQLENVIQIKIFQFNETTIIINKSNSTNISLYSENDLYYEPYPLAKLTNKIIVKLENQLKKFLIVKII